MAPAHSAKCLIQKNVTEVPNRPGACSEPTLVLDVGGEKPVAHQIGRPAGTLASFGTCFCNAETIRCHCRRVSNS